MLFGRLLERLDRPVTLAAGGEKATLLAGMNAVDHMLDFEALPMHELFADAPEQTGRLNERLGPCGRLISCFPGDAKRDAPARMRLVAACGAAGAAFLPIRPPVDFDGHLLDLWTDMLGLPRIARDAPAWATPREWRLAGSDILAKAGITDPRSAAVLHPGSGGAAKCWPLDRYRKLAEWAARREFLPVFLLGPVELDRWPSDARSSLARTAPVVSAPPPTGLAGILAAAAVYVGNDSGVSHLAAAVGTPTVALFGPTPARQFAPIGPQILTVQAESMRAIRVPQAAAAVERLFASATGASSRPPVHLE